MGDDAQALSDAQAAVRLAPESSHALAVLAMAQRDNGQLAEAEATVSTAIELGVDLSDPDANEKVTSWQGTFTKGQVEFAGFFVFRGNLRSSQGKYEEALKDFERALEQGCSEFDVLEGMREVATRSKLPALAKRVAERTREIEAAVAAHEKRAAPAEEGDD